MGDHQFTHLPFRAIHPRARYCLEVAAQVALTLFQPPRRASASNALLGGRGMTDQSKLQGVRKTLEEKAGYLRKLQRDKVVAPHDRQGMIQEEIDIVSREIARLDTRVQELLKNPR